MILITGAARSGTSLTTGMLQRLGAYLGRPQDINDLNENVAIRQNILKPYLRSIGADPLGQSVIAPPEAVKLRPGLREDVEAVFADGPQPWAYKDAKITLCWQAWAEAFPDAIWVIVRRDAEKIVDSCIRTKFMRHYGDDRDGWMGWVRAHEERFEAMKAAGLDFIEVWQRDVAADIKAFRPVAEHCGLPFDAAKAGAGFNPTLWNG